MHECAGQVVSNQTITVRDHVSQSTFIKYHQCQLLDSYKAMTKRLQEHLHTAQQRSSQVTRVFPNLMSRDDDTNAPEYFIPNPLLRPEVDVVGP